MIYSLEELKQVKEEVGLDGKESVIDMILRSQAEFYARTQTKDEQEEEERQRRKETMRAEFATQKALKNEIKSAMTSG